MSWYGLFLFQTSSWDLVVVVKHFIGFLAAVFLGLFLAIMYKDDQKGIGGANPVVKIFGYSSFTSKWGPGPKLKELFEKNCKCKIEFIEGSDSGILLQRLKIEGESLGADLVVGFDQFDLSKAQNSLKWREMTIDSAQFEDSVKPALINKNFIPYDWGVLAFNARKSELANPPQQLEDLLKPEFAKKIALQDPRTSSPGLQLFYWVMKTKGEEQGTQFLKQMITQAHSFSPSWSSSYGLFTKKQASLVFSYVTSPIYHLIEEKNNSYEFLSFDVPHPVQFEFVGIPEFCQNCDLAEKFVNLMLSAEGQKILMQKNYMLPVLKNVKNGTPFADIVMPKVMSTLEIPTTEEVDRWLKKWGEIRRSQAQ